MLTISRISVSLAALAMMAISCTTGRFALSADDVENRIMVNGEAVVPAGDQNLLELLRRKATARRLGESSPDQQPLVLIDGVAATDGTRSLAEIPAFHAESVTFVRASEAVPAYGSRARFGAIIVKTRRGA